MTSESCTTSQAFRSNELQGRRWLWATLYFSEKRYRKAFSFGVFLKQKVKCKESSEESVILPVRFLFQLFVSIINLILFICNFFYLVQFISMYLISNFHQVNKNISNLIYTISRLLIYTNSHEWIFYLCSFRNKDFVLEWN